MKETGKIIKIISNDLVEVELKGSAACAKCNICLFKSNGTATINAKNKIGAALGQYVEIEIPEGRVVLSAILVFILPIVSFFAGYLISGIYLAVLFLAVYLVFLYMYDRRTQAFPQVTRVL